MQQATKYLVALGMASIWVVFVSIFMKLLKRYRGEKVILSTSLRYRYLTVTITLFIALHSLVKKHKKH
jgi:hypothetical protein